MCCADTRGRHASAMLLPFHSRMSRSARGLFVRPVRSTCRTPRSRRENMFACPAGPMPAVTRLITCSQSTQQRDRPAKRADNAQNTSNCSRQEVQDLAHRHALQLIQKGLQRQGCTNWAAPCCMPRLCQAIHGHQEWWAPQVCGHLHHQVASLAQVAVHNAALWAICKVSVE